MGVRKVRVLNPVTLPGNNQQVISQFVKCFGARQVGFLITATNGNPIETHLGSVSQDGVNGNSAAAASTMVDLATGTTLASNAIGVPLNTSGGKWVLFVPSTGLAARYTDTIDWNFMRITLTSPAAGATPTDDITGLTVDAYVWDDLDYPQYAMGFPPT